MNLFSHGAEETANGGVVAPVKRFIVWSALCIFGAVAMSGSALAGTWSSTYSLNYSMGERDSRSSLRRIALEEARAKAASEAGMVVLNEQQLRDDTLIEQTRLVSAAMIKLTIQSEAIEVSGGNSKIEFRILAEVDDSELDRQLSAMRTDVRKNDLIATLARENQRLRLRFESVRKARSGASDPTATRLEDDHIEALSLDLETSRRQAYRVLNGMESNHAAADQAEAEARLVDNVIMLPLLGSRLKVDVKPWRKNGTSIEVPVALSWEFDIAAMKTASLQFSTPRGLRGGPSANGFCAKTEEGNPPRQSPAGLQLLRDAVAIEVTLGDSKSYFAIGAEGDFGQFCVVNSSFSAPRTVLLSLPEAKTHAVASISAKTVRMSDVAAEWKPLVRTDLLTGGL